MRKASPFNSHRVYKRATNILRGQRPGKKDAAVKLLKRIACDVRHDDTISNKNELECNDADKIDHERAWRARACNTLANFYLEGQYVQKDTQEAIKYFRQAIGLGSKAAAVQLDLLDFDVGVDMDINVKGSGLDVAVSVGRAASELAKSVPLAEYYLSLVKASKRKILESGDQDSGSHANWKSPLQNAARAGISGAQLRLGLTQLPPGLCSLVDRATLSVPKRFSSAQWNNMVVDDEELVSDGIEWIFKAASRGFARAIFVAGKLLMCLPSNLASEQEHLGFSTSMSALDSVSAPAWFNSESDRATLLQGYGYVLHAAESGDREAQFQVGLWHEETVDVEIMDPCGVIVRKVVSRASLNPSVSSMSWGMPVFGGIFDDAVAIQWYASAVERPSVNENHRRTSNLVDHGHPGALTRLGRLIERGCDNRAVPDLELAADCYQRAAKLGSVGAMHCLGRLHVTAVAKAVRNDLGESSVQALSRKSSVSVSDGSVNHANESAGETSASLKWAPSLSKGVEWFELACRTGRSPVSAFCAGVTLERMAESTVKHILEGPNDSVGTTASERIGFDLAERAASMFAVCAEDSSRLADMLQYGFGGFGRGLHARETFQSGKDDEAPSLSISPEPIKSVALYRFAMILLRWPPPFKSGVSQDRDQLRRQMVTHGIHMLAKLATDNSAESHDVDEKEEGNSKSNDSKISGEVTTSSDLLRSEHRIVVGLAAHTLGRLSVEGVMAPRSTEQGVGDLPAVLNPSVSSAVKWFQVAAAAGNGNASFAMGSLLESGKGKTNTNFNPALARSWYARAAHQLLDNDFNSFPDFGDGPSLNIEVEDAGLLSSYDSETEYIKGILYMTGVNGETANPKRGIQWLRRSAHHRNPEAMFTLAWMTLQKRQNSRSLQNAALRSLHAAAMEGHAESSQQIGLMYARGMGVLPDRVKAASWAEVAHKQRACASRPNTILWRRGWSFL